MKRRTFIRNTAAFLPGIFLAPSLLSGCKREDLSESTKTVVIIGAGVAGLGAAYTLKQAGLQNLIVLEARDRIGGRVWTDQSLGFPVDLGASWIHGPSRRNPLVDLASSAGLESSVTDDDSQVVYNANGDAFTDDEFDTAEAEYLQLLKDVINSGSKDASVRDRIEALQPDALNDAWMLYFLSSYDEFDYGADIDQLSSQYYQEDRAFAGKDEIVKNGYGKLPEYLATGIDVRLSEVVSAIDYSSASIRVTTGTSTYDADHVIIAVPLGVLKSNGITFTPALPAEKTGAMGRMSMGAMNKVVLSFPSAFWDIDSQYIGYTGPTKGKYNYFLNFRKFGSENILMTFAYGDFAEQMEAQTDQQVQDDVMAHLQAIYGTGIPLPSGFLRSNWKSDPFTQGSYCPAVKGMNGDEFEVLSGTVDDRIYFAGEHTSQDYRGTVHGAYLSGVREAERVMQEL